MVVAIAQLFKTVPELSIRKIEYEKKKVKTYCLPNLDELFHFFSRKKISPNAINVQQFKTMDELKGWNSVGKKYHKAICLTNLFYKIISLFQQKSSRGLNSQKKKTVNIRVGVKLEEKKLLCEMSKQSQTNRHNSLIFSKIS